MTPSPPHRMVSKWRGEKWKGLTPDVTGPAYDLIPNRVLSLRKTGFFRKNGSEMALDNRQTQTTYKRVWHSEIWSSACQTRWEIPLWTFGNFQPFGQENRYKQNELIFKWKKKSFLWPFTYIYKQPIFRIMWTKLLEISLSCWHRQNQ